ncbi:hypothetical protein ACFLYA_02345 [Candidatus Dependentiae bacterium]
MNFVKKLIVLFFVVFALQQTVYCMKSESSKREDKNKIIIKKTLEKIAPLDKGKFMNHSQEVLVINNIFKDIAFTSGELKVYLKEILKFNDACVNICLNDPTGVSVFTDVFNRFIVLRLLDVFLGADYELISPAIGKIINKYAILKLKSFNWEFFSSERDVNELKKKMDIIKNEYKQIVAQSDLGQIISDDICLAIENNSTALKDLPDDNIDTDKFSSRELIDGYMFGFFESGPEKQDGVRLTRLAKKIKSFQKKRVVLVTCLKSKILFGLHAGVCKKMLSRLNRGFAKIEGFFDCIVTTQKK